MTIEKAAMTPKNANWIVKNWNIFNFDHSVQRQANIWDNERESLLIHSILYGYPIPPVFAVEDAWDINGKNTKVYNFLDGKQRMNAVARFIREEYALAPTTPDVNIGTEDEPILIEIAGKTFTELSETFQNDIMQFGFTIYLLRNIQGDDVEQIFLRLNNGVPLTRMELTRASASGIVVNFLNEVCTSPFFKNSIALTKLMRKRYVDQELMLQILSLLMNKSISFSGDDLEAFAIELKKNGGVPEEIKSKMFTVTNYLEQAFPETDSMLKKVHVPMIFMVAEKAIEDNIAPVKFAGLIQYFLGNQTVEYKDAAGTSTGKLVNIQTRSTEMRNYYDLCFGDKVEYDYVLPSVKKALAEEEKKRKAEEREAKKKAKAEEKKRIEEEKRAKENKGKFVAKSENEKNENINQDEKFA